MHIEESAPKRVILPRRRRLAEIPSGNPLKHILERELLGRVAHRKRHGRKHAVTVDYFCGAGGLTTGVERARERLGIPGYHYGINHDEYAIQTISSNHHGTFVNSSVESIPVREIVREGYITLFTGAAECFPRDTLILTDRGYRPIAEVMPGDRVLTHRNRWRRVEAKLSKRDDTIVVKGRGHFGIETTANHPFWVKTRGRKWNNERRNYVGTYTDPAWIHASQLNERHYWASPSQIRKLPVPSCGDMNIDEGFWWFVGRFIGDGSFGGPSHPTAITISCGKHEAESLLVALAKATSLKWSRNDVRTATNFTTNHRVLKEWLRDYVGTHAISKSIPAFVYGLPDITRRALLDGYLSADGHFASRKREWSANTVSRALAFSLRTLLETLGLFASMTYIPRVNATIEGRSVNARPQYRVSWYDPLVRSQTLTKTGGHTWGQVREVAATGLHKTVYTLQVAEDNSYVAEGVVVKNCIMHSTARRSDLPIYDQSRTSAAYMLEAIHDLPPEAIILENVPEWERWSVLDPKTLRPVKGREGEYFQAFVKALREMGYNIEWRVLNAADYGSCTSRRRLFLLGTAEDRPVLWPVQSHAKNPEKHPGHDLKPWRASREIIDWSDLGSSLFSREGGPHAVKSLRRMMTGFSEQAATLAQGYAAAIGVFIPISDAFHGTRAPKFEFNGEDFKKNQALRAYAKPPAKGKKVTIATAAERVYISNVWRALYDLPRGDRELSPKERKTILKRGIDRSRAATRLAFSRPVASFTIDGDAAYVETFALANRVHAAGNYTDRDPLPVATTATGGGLVHVAPLVLGQHEGAIAHNACTDPIPTIATKGAIGAAEPRLVKMNASETSAFGDETRSTSVPFGTIVGKTCIGLSTPAAPEPMLSAYYGDSDGRPRAPRPVSEPMGTQPTENRFGLLTGVTPEPVVTQDYGKSVPASVGSPLPSPTAHANKFGVLDPVTPEALLVTMNHGGGEDGRVASPEHPLGTLTTKGSTGLARPFIARQNGFFGEAAAERAIESTSEPLSSVSAGGQHHGLVSPAEPFLFEQRCAGPDDPGVRSTQDAVPTITTISWIGLVNAISSTARANPATIVPSTIARTTSDSRCRPQRQAVLAISSPRVSATSSRSCR